LAYWIVIVVRFCSKGEIFWKKTCLFVCCDIKWIHQLLAVMPTKSSASESKVLFRSFKLHWFCIRWVGNRSSTVPVLSCLKRLLKNFLGQKSDTVMSLCCRSNEILFCTSQEFFMHLKLWRRVSPWGYLLLLLTAHWLSLSLATLQELLGWISDSWIKIWVKSYEYLVSRVIDCVLTFNNTLW